MPCCYFVRCKVSVLPFLPGLQGRHRPPCLCRLSTLKDSTGRQGRWALRMQEHNFSVAYKSEKHNRDADCPSYYPVVPPEPDSNDAEFEFLTFFDLADIAAQQRRGPHSQDLIGRLCSGDTTSTSQFYIQGGILYRHNFRPTASS